MAYSRNIDDTAPPATFNNLAFTHALFQEAPDVDGTPPVEGTETTLETITLSPVDNDPANPVLRDLTTDLATLQTAWYRIVWVKASGAEFAAEWRFIDDNADPTPSDLTTVAAVREFLQKPDSDTGQDDIISDLIGRASSAIQRFTRRQFLPRSNATRAFLAVNGWVDLCPYDLQSATTVTFAGASTDTPATVTAGSNGYQLRPVPAADGVYQYLLLPGYAGQDGDVTITGNWGWPEIPTDVEHWCIVTVCIWLRRDVSAFSASLRLEENRMERPDALPSAARLGLAHYRLQHSSL